MSEKLNPRTKDLTGQRFGQITVLKFAGYLGSKNQTKATWECKCDCGLVWIVNASKLLRGQNWCRKCCNSHIYRDREKRAKLRDSEHVGVWYLLNVQRRAENRGYEYRITLQDVEDQWVKQNGKCALTDIKLTPTCDFTMSTASQGNTASLDRIDSSKKIYIAGNIQWVHKDINNMKLDHPESHFIKMCKLVADKARRNKKEER